jgi:hypothetical protein
MPMPSAPGVRSGCTFWVEGLLGGGGPGGGNVLLPQTGRARTALTAPPPAHGRTLSRCHVLRVRRLDAILYASCMHIVYPGGSDLRLRQLPRRVHLLPPARDRHAPASHVDVGRQGTATTLLVLYDCSYSNCGCGCGSAGLHRPREACGCGGDDAPDAPARHAPKAAGDDRGAGQSRPEPEQS